MVPARLPYDSQHLTKIALFLLKESLCKKLRTSPFTLDRSMFFIFMNYKKIKEKRLNLSFKSLCLNKILFNLSANKVLVAIEIDSESISYHLESLVGVHNIRLWHLFDFATIFEHSKLLELLNGSGGTELLSHEERVILLWKLQTNCWVSDNNSNRDKAEQEHDDGRSLMLKMHSGIWIWELVVEILILVSYTMMIVVLHIVENSKVIMHEASSIKVLREEIESNIVPMRRLDLIGRSINMLEVSWEWKRGGFGIKHSHLSFKEFIFASIVICIFIAHSQSGGEKGRFRHHNRISSKHHRHCKSLTHF